MKETGVIFTAESVRAILAGTKTQTRRVIKPDWWRCLEPEDDEDRAKALLMCPYGVPGDRLWVRETWMPDPTDPSNQQVALYRADIRADGEADERSIVRKARRDGVDIPQWKPSIFMPRWASRITLEVLDVRVQRVRETNVADAWAEGCPYRRSFPDTHRTFHAAMNALDWYKEGWDSINAKRGYSWKSNPWVWAITFRRLV